MPPTASVSAQSRLPGLDLLRAWAIVWVMLTHGGMFGLIGDDNWFAGYGWMGVDLFFALSGYLIAGQLLRPFADGGSPNYSRFFARRLLRTLPAYLAVVALYFLFPVLQDRDQIQPLWRFLTFTQNLWTNPAGKTFSHAWSLCVEEQFYLVLPLAVALLAWRPTSAEDHAAVVGVIGARHGPCAVSVAGRRRGAPLRHHLRAARRGLHATDLLSDLVAPRRPAGRYRRCADPGVPAGVVGSPGAAGKPPDGRRGRRRRGGHVAVSEWRGRGILRRHARLPPAGVVDVAAGDRRRQSARLIGRWTIPGAGALAAGAYSLYLSHKIVFHQVGLWSQTWPQAEKGFAFAVAFALACVVAAALYWLVERPFLKLRDRFRAPPSHLWGGTDREAVRVGESGAVR